MQKIMVVAAFGLLLASCADAPTMLAGGAKGMCKGSGSAPCTRPPPGYTPTTPPK